MSSSNSSQESDHCAPPITYSAHMSLPSRISNKTILLLLRDLIIHGAPLMLSLPNRISNKNIFITIVRPDYPWGPVTGIITRLYSIIDLFGSITNEPVIGFIIHGAPCCDYHMTLFIIRSFHLFRSTTNEPDIGFVMHGPPYTVIIM